MKKYIEAELELVEFDAEDVIATSCDEHCEGYCLTDCLTIALEPAP